MKPYFIQLLLLMAAQAAAARHYDFSAQRISTADGLPSNVVSRIWQDKEGYMWFEIRNGLCRYDGYVLQTVDRRTVSVPAREKALTTRDATWLREGQGRLARLGKDGKRQSWQMIPSDIISYTRNDHFHVSDVDERTEAISTYGSGLYLYDKPTGELTQLTKESTRGLLDDDYLTGLYVDRTGCIWLIEDYLGVKCLRMNQLNYRPLWLQPDAKIQDANYIRCIAPMGNDELLVSNQMGDVYSLNAKLGTVSAGHGNVGAVHGAMGAVQGTVSAEPRYRVYAALHDSQGRKWTGTRGNGLWVDGQRVEGLPSPHIFNIREATDGSIMVSMLEGGVALLKGGVALPEGGVALSTARQHEWHRLLQGKNAHDAQTDGRGRLWVAAEEGLYLFDRQRRLTDSLPGCFVCLLVDSHGTVWAGSTDTGLIHATSQGDSIRPTRYTKEHGLATGGVLSVVEDKAGCVWMGTEEGLVRLNPNTGDIVHHIIAESPLSNVFCERTAVCLSNGHLLFGSHNGMVEVTPTTDATPAPTATVVTSLLVNGELTPGDRPQLTYQQNNLTFQFSNFQYARQQSVLYQYRLDGAEGDWCPPTTEHSALYRRLPPGRYTFRVRSTAGGGVWGSETVMSLSISQPWWNTWWAWMVYATVLLLSALATLRIVLLHRSLEIERRVSAFKQDFYSRLERELRAPINVVSGAAENVQLSGTSKTTVQSLRRGSRRVLKLMDLVRQFHQMDTDEMQQKAEREDLGSEAEQVFSDIRKSGTDGGQELKELAPPPINEQTLVVIDQDADSLAHLTDTLNPYFKVVATPLLEEGEKAVTEHRAQVVIMDVTHDEQLARQLTQRLRATQPAMAIVHLSAFGDDAHQLRSLRAGATDYLQKPFSSRVLIERVSNITAALCAQAAASNNLPQQPLQAPPREGCSPTPTLLTDVKAKKFLDRMQAILASHVSDENFSVEQWAELMGLKRVQFYKKVKTLTGETPVAHLHRARLDYAARLLRDSRATVEDVMTRAGFHSATYFYNAFRKQFGLSPRDYRTT